MRKLSKKLLLSILSVALVFIALGTTTFAWFSMNSVVTAKDMKVQIVAEKGLLINEVATANDTNWDNEASANQLSAKISKLYPTSTTNGTTWYHAASKKSASAAAATSGSSSADIVTSTTNTTGYETLPSLTAITTQSASATAGTQAAFDTMGKNAGDEAGYYVHYTYYLKSSGAQIALGTASGAKNVQIKSVVATEPSTKASAELNKSLRVGIKLNSVFYIYAPVTGYTDTYYVAAGTTATQPIAGATPTLTDLATLPASSANGTQVDVYIWYEGEDAHCLSDNATAATLDEITVVINFELVDVQ